jgi:ribonuclease HI
VKTTLPGNARKSDTSETLTDATLLAIRQADADYVLYTDGSAEGECRNDGYAVVVTRGPPGELVAVHTIRSRGKVLTSSFEEERSALLAAAMCIRDNVSDNRVLVCSDSQAALAALDNNSPELQEVAAILNYCTAAVACRNPVDTGSLGNSRKRAGRPCSEGGGASPTRRAGYHPYLLPQRKGGYPKPVPGRSDLTPQDSGCLRQQDPSSSRSDETRGRAPRPA